MSNNRWINKTKAYNLNVKRDPIETGLQQSFTRDIQSYILERQETFYPNNKEWSLTGYTHLHKCAFQLMSNDKKWCAAQCKKERAKLPTPTYEYANYCDICPKMTYVAFDNELNVIFANRTFTEDYNRQV